MKTSNRMTKKARYPITERDSDRSVKPTDDFFAFANNVWRRKNPIPETESRWGNMEILSRKNEENLHRILEALRMRQRPRIGSEAQKLRDFYAAAMDGRGREGDGILPIEPVLKRIGAARKRTELLRLIADLHATGVDVLWNPSVEQDAKRSDRMILDLSQGGLGLPDRDYYLKDDADSRKIRVLYKAYIADMLALGGVPERTARENARSIFAIETKLARASMTMVERRDPEAQYNKMSPAKLTGLAPNIDWRSYFRMVDLPPVRKLLVSQPKFMKTASALWKSVPVAAWRTYLSWHCINRAAPYLSGAFVDRHFAFYGTVLSGAKKKKPLWQRAVRNTNGMLGELLGKRYVERHFSPESKAQMNELVDNLFAVYREHIRSLSWMSAATKKHALEKLSRMRRKLGYPDKWRDYEALTVRHDSWVMNVSRVSSFAFRRNMQKHGKSVDRTEWFMSPATVNAYYHPTLVEVVFPAGILQPPFFDPDADDAVNYGAIGVIIGHELTHGFDDMGSRFDAEGNLKNWWGKADRKRFDEYTGALAEQFNACKVVGNLYANGALTVGENTADLGGACLAYDALQKSFEKNGRPDKINGMTPEERFFLGYARVWAENIRDEELKRHVITDPHAPARLRTNVPLSNLDEFHETFGGKEGDLLYREKRDRIRIW